MIYKLFLVLFISTSVFAQTEEATLAVRGNCGMCKARIEKAAIKTKGVKYAVWQAQTEELTVLLNPSKTSLVQLAENISAVGHEANGIVVDKTIYDALPLCCQYVMGETKENDDPKCSVH